MLHYWIMTVVVSSQGSSEAVWAALDRQYEAFHDVSFAFEGEFGPTNARSEWTGKTVSFEGRGAWHCDGIAFIERQRETPIGLRRWTKSLDRGGDWVERVSGPKENSPPGGQVQRKEGIGMLLGDFDTWVYLWPTACLVAASRAERNLFTYGGTQDVDGLNCHLLELRNNDAAAFTWRLWISPDRGWNVVKTEEWFGDILGFTTCEYVFSQFEGRTVPVRCVRLRYATMAPDQKPPLKPSPHPTYKTNYRMVVSTVEVGKGRSADKFRVVVDRKYHVFGAESLVSNSVDYTKGASGGAPVPRLDDVDKAREAEAKVLAGGQGLPQSVGATNYTWLIALGASLLGMGLYLRWRRGAA